MGPHNLRTADLPSLPAPLSDIRVTLLTFPLSRWGALWFRYIVYEVKGVVLFEISLVLTSSSAIISTQPYLCQFNQQGFTENGLCMGPTESVQGGITAAMPGGSWLGALVSGVVSDMFGRKTSIQIGAIIWYVPPCLTRTCLTGLGLLGLSLFAPPSTFRCSL